MKYLILLQLLVIDYKHISNPHMQMNTEPERWRLVWRSVGGKCKCAFVSSSDLFHWRNQDKHWMWQVCLWAPVTPPTHDFMIIAFNGSSQ